MAFLSLFGLYWVLSIGKSCIYKLISLLVPQSANIFAEVTSDPCDVISGLSSYCLLACLSLLGLYWVLNNSRSCIYELISLLFSQSADSLAR